ncbi:hypothetical protein ABCR94_03025 [Streptomyces sp. 21So2-11]|uniref:hypothetical protein n=1 Tax=Streptomyces sp. 21So2-11 TaxID=3144408 RepID=UPI00321A5F58
MRDELIVNPRAVPLAPLDDFRDATAGPCAPPDRFGRHTDAWWDTIGSGRIPEVLDAHSRLAVRVAEAGLFAPGAVDGDRQAGMFADASRARPERVRPPG